MWGKDLTDPTELIAAVAAFSSLCVHEKRELVTEVMCKSHLYRSLYLGTRRDKKKNVVQAYERISSDLKIKELMAIWGVDQGEAKASYKERLNIDSFESLLLRHEILVKDFKSSKELEPSYYNEEDFVDTKFNESDDDGGDDEARVGRSEPDFKKTKKILAHFNIPQKRRMMDNQMKKTGLVCSETRKLDAERKNVLANVETYWMKIHRGMREETKFNQSDDKERKETLETEDKERKETLETEDKEEEIWKKPDSINLMTKRVKKRNTKKKKKKFGRN